ncbi:hypothetical protein [Kribbella sp. CA-293567]|uniref:hypothetical protein n=1 Tax=Kribbella sp. CA-293567 TaxID=3002436 RepID=UPI0022DD16BC|nr:hypothetical protein [Kribbella sp. CA-293567]WBQ06886.1 hypothetical protein OX958_08830 [Kribbella sp. CA-293567]
MSDQSSKSDYDRKVKAILDRVAAGHLTSDEAATLIAALSSTSTPAAAGSSSPASAGIPAADSDVPSPSVWAEAVDSPNPGAWPSTSSGSPAATSTGTSTATGSSNATSGDSANTSTSNSSATGTGNSAATDSSNSAATDSADSAATSAEPTRTAAGSTGEGTVVDDSAVVPEPAEPVLEQETLHSDLVVPSGVRRVTIRAIGRRVRLVGEPAVTGVAVDGPHVIKRDGDTLSINSEGDMGVSIDGLSMLRNPTDLKSHVNGLAKELWIRVNPMLDVEVEVTGGSVQAERLPGLSRVRVTAGTAKVTDVDGPIDLLVQAGTATLDAQITKGRSRVRVESGSANITLRRGSDVRVHTEAQLGRVSWTGAVSGQSKDVEIGRGRAALDVEVLVGSAQITSD